MFFTFIWAQGAATSETCFHLEADFVESGCIRIMTFDGGGAFLPKRATGATGKNLKVEPSSFLGSDHPPATEKTNRIREGVKLSHEEVLN
jgi:hypothetical protein